MDSLPQRIFLIRHGETEWAATDKHTGFTDIPLTEKGRAQGELLRKRLQGHNFEKVFTSPLKRAKDTCDIVGYGKKAIIDSDLVEWDYGKYEGLTTAEIHKIDPNWTVFDKGAPGGESIANISARADHFLAKLKGCKADVAVFSSGHFLRVLAARWTGLRAHDGRVLALSTGSLSILGFEHATHVILCWNDISHLQNNFLKP